MPTKQFHTQAQPTEAITFEVDGEEFTAAGVPPANAILRTAELGMSENDGEKVRALGQFLDVVLMPESHARFSARMSNPEKPVDVETVGDVVAWLLEVYTGRPTEPSSPSSPESSPSDGRNSTDTAPVLASTP